MSFNLKNEKCQLKNDKKWSCKLISFSLKNEKCHLKNDKKWSCIAGFRVALVLVILVGLFMTGIKKFWKVRLR